MIDAHLMDVLFRIWENGFATNSFPHGGGWEAQATHLIGDHQCMAVARTERHAFLLLAKQLGIDIDLSELEPVETETFAQVAA